MSSATKSIGRFVPELSISIERFRMEAEYLCYKCCNMSVTLTELEQKVSDVHNGLQLLFFKHYAPVLASQLYGIFRLHS